MSEPSPARRAGFLLLSVLALGACGGDGGPTVAPATSTSTTSTAATVPETTSSTAPAVPTETFEFAGGAVAGGPRTIEASLGDRLRIVVRSDARDEVHLHGYDVRVVASPGVEAILDVTASIPGRFELELEDSGAKLGELEVR